MCSLFFDLPVDASEFILGNAMFFENIEVSKDNVHKSLVLPSDILGDPTKLCLEIVFASLCVLSPGEC